MEYINNTEIFMLFHSILKNIFLLYTEALGAREEIPRLNVYFSFAC